MFEIKDNVLIGKYIKELIGRKYKSDREFCRRYLELQTPNNVNEGTVGNMANRLSQIEKGKKQIQIYDLPYFCELLGTSCEELLSGGNSFVPSSNHITNYEVAFSKDVKTWESYLDREDKLVLNCDEYGMSVIDYALKFKNYEFMKYLVEKHYIWLVDNSKLIYDGVGYGAGTSIQRRQFASMDSYLELKLTSEDKLRTDLVSLAIENHDNELLDKLKAREIPPFSSLSYVGAINDDYSIYRNDNLIKAIANSDNDTLDYFFAEFNVTDRFNSQNTMVYQDIDKVIERMTIERNDKVKLFIEKGIRHNEKTYQRLVRLIGEALENCLSSENDELVATYMKKSILQFLKIDKKNRLVSFFYTKEKKNIGMVTNIIHLEHFEGDSFIKKQMDELNRWYDKIVDLKGEYVNEEDS